MTRRDYCAVCGTMVEDNDPCCYECGVSLHSDCATGYDADSRIYLLYALLHNNIISGCDVNNTKPYNYDFSVEKLIQLYYDIIDPEMLKTIHEYASPYGSGWYKNDKDEVKEKNKKIIDDNINDLFKLVKKYEKFMKTDLVSEEDNLKIFNIFDDVVGCYTDMYEFCCINCHKGIKISY